MDNLKTVESTAWFEDRVAGSWGLSRRLGMAKTSLGINLRRADKIAFEKGILNPRNFSAVNTLGTRNIGKDFLGSLGTEVSGVYGTFTA